MPLEIELEGPLFIGRSLDSMANLAREEKVNAQVRRLFEHTAGKDSGFAATVILGGILADVLTAGIAQFDEAISRQEGVFKTQETRNEDHIGKMKGAEKGHIAAMERMVGVVLKVFEDFRMERANMVVEMHRMHRKLDHAKALIKIAAGAGIGVVAVIVFLIVYAVKHAVV